jgi:hypothetical protein
MVHDPVGCVAGVQAETQLMSEPRIIRVSPHVLMDALACETKLWVRHKQGFTSKSDAMKAAAGIAFHAATAAYFEQLAESAPGTIQTEAAISVLHAHYDRTFERLTPEKLEVAYTPKNLETLMRRWIEMHPPATLPWRKVLMVEEAFISRTFEFNDGLTGEPVIVQLIVRPDLIVEDNNGMVRWVDTKTTGWHINDENWRHEIQLSLQTELYSDAIAQRFGNKALLAGWINASEIRDLPKGPAGRKGVCKQHQQAFSECAGKHLCTEHQRPVAECGPEHAKTDLLECMTTPERIEGAIATVRKGVEAYVRVMQVENVRDLATDGSARGNCRFCFAAEWCLTSRPAAALPTWRNFVHEPYPVTEGKRC